MESLRPHIYLAETFYEHPNTTFYEHPNTIFEQNEGVEHAKWRTREGMAHLLRLSIIPIMSGKPKVPKRTM